MDLEPPPWMDDGPPLVDPDSAPPPHTRTAGRVFDRGDDVELGRDLAQQLNLTGQTVHAEESLWRYTDGTWAAVVDAEARKAAADYAGRKRWGRGKRDEPIEIAISLSAGRVAGIVQTTKDDLDAPQHFATAPYGAPFARTFARVDGARLVLEPLAAWHRVKRHHAAGYEPDTARPEWTDWLLADTWRGCDDVDERTRYFWEWLGAALVGIAPRYKDSPLLVGPKDTGKSRLVQAIACCFPVESRRSVALQDFSREYQRAYLSTGRLNYVNELPARELMDGEAAKAILSGDTVNCRHPSGRPFDWTSRMASVFACNALPPSRDPALMGRFVVLDCPHVVPAERQDKTLPAKIDAEAPRIAAAALAALPALLARGHFIRPSSDEQASKDWQIASDPVAAWAVDHIEASHTLTSGKELRDHFCAWARDNGNMELSTTMFGLRLRSLGFARQHTAAGQAYRAEILTPAKQAAKAAWQPQNRYGD